MLFRLLALICLIAATSIPASAQFGKPKPTPKSAAEYYAERALIDASRMSAGGTRDVVQDSDGVDLRRAEFWFDEAVKGYTALCEDRSLPRDQWARNCFALADIHRRGMGIPQDYDLAKRYYDDACLIGDHMDACLQQAYLSHKGRSGTVDLLHARKLYDFACDQRDQRACAGLGNMLYLGLGGRKDRTEGANLLQRACASDYDWACTRLTEFGLPERVGRF